MPSIGSLYAKVMHQHFTPMYANWQPGTPIRLGDFGTISDNIFRREGNVADAPFNLTFGRREDPSADHYDFTSSSKTEFIFTAAGSGSGGSVGSVKASVEIKFGSENSVFFNAAGCRLISVEDIRGLGQALLPHLKTGAWKESYVLVTALLESQSTTVVVSSASDASILLEAKADGIKDVDLADAAIKLGLKRQKNVGFKAVTAEGMSPLLGLMQLKRSRNLFGRVSDPRFEPALRAEFSTKTADHLAKRSAEFAKGDDDEVLFVYADGNPSSEDF